MIEVIIPNDMWPKPETLADIAAMIVRDALPAVESGAACLVPRYQIDRLKYALSSAAPAIYRIGPEGNATLVECEKCAQQTMDVGEPETLTFSRKQGAAWVQVDSYRKQDGAWVQIPCAPQSSVVGYGEIVDGKLMQYSHTPHGAAVTALCVASQSVPTESLGRDGGTCSRRCAETLVCDNSCAPAPASVAELRLVAKRNLKRMIEIGSDDKALMLKCLEELS